MAPLRSSTLAIAALFALACTDAPEPAPSTSAALLSASASSATSAPKSDPNAQADAASALPLASPPSPEMARVPAAAFLMGSPIARGNPEERPMHERVVATFDLDLTETTVADYRACMDAGACTRPHPEDEFCNFDMKGDRSHHPINCVDHLQATAFCAWKRKRLPTEAEWELAAGGFDERRFSWGNEDPTTKIACFSHPGGTCEVGMFPAGAFGLFDMSGNLWEWTDSWFAMFPGEPDHGTDKVFKGGSFSRRWPKWLRIKNRSHWPREKANAWLGFRCARSVTPTVCPENAEARDGRCVRVSGDPMCEPKLGWNGSACAHLDAHGKPTGKVPDPRDDKSGMPGAPTDEIVVSRTPNDDGDCVAHYPGKPAAWRWTGNTWDARVKLVAARGCTRRDNAPTWVSACCRE